MPHVIVFLPGTLGSEILLNGEKIWPGSLPQFLTGFSQEQFNKLLDPAGISGDIIRSFSIVSQYSALVSFLQSSGFNEQGQPPTLYVCPYDWRKSNREAAKTLDAKIRQVTSDHQGQADITVVGHSMGGLVARYYLESGIFDSAPGFSLIKNLYTLATPHLGAPIAVIKALAQDKTIFLSGDQIRTLAANPLYPSLYELFPRRDQPVVWDASSQPIFGPVDLFGASGVAAGLSKANLAAADLFHQALRPPDPTQTRVRYFFFSGTQKKTTINLIANAGSTGKVTIIQSERDDAGDGTVPIWSSKFGLFPSEYVGGEHSEIYKDYQLQQTLKQLLAPPGIQVMALAAPQVVVTVTELVLRPGDVSQLDITLASRATSLAGVLVVERAVLAPDESLQGYAPVGAGQSISYQGPAFDRLRIEFTAPGQAGIYRITFTLADQSASGSDEFFVQTHPQD